MCSTIPEGFTNTIQISDEAYTNLEEKEDLKFKQSSAVAKGKGKLTTWLVSEDLGEEEAMETLSVN